MEVLELDHNPKPLGPPIRELEYTSGYAPRMPLLSWVLFLGFLASPTCMGTLRSCKEAFSKFTLGARSAPSGWACITVCTPEEPLNWGIAVKRGDNMVVVFSIDAFTRNELLAS